MWSLDLHETTTGALLGETYRNNEACRKFVGYITEAERVVMSQQIANTPFYSVLSDESTDECPCFPEECLQILPE